MKLSDKPDQKQNLPESLPAFIECGEEELPSDRELWEKAKTDSKRLGLEHRPYRSKKRDDSELHDLEFYFRDLNLNLDDLEEKNVLDIGSGPGFFKKAVDRIGKAKS